MRIVENARTTEILGDGKRVVGLVYADRDSGEERKLALDGVFVQIGLVANTEWLRESRVDSTEWREIRVDARGANAALGAFDALIRSPRPEGGASAGDAAVA